MNQAATKSETTLSHKVIWWRWHKDHLEVYERFIQVAFDLIAQGHKRYSQDAILHVIRFELNRTKPDERDQYKINNNFSAYYARLFRVDYPQYKNFFELRELASEK